MVSKFSQSKKFTPWKGVSIVCVYTGGQTIRFLFDIAGTSELDIDGILEGLKECVYVCVWEDEVISVYV